MPLFYIDYGHAPKLQVYWHGVIQMLSTCTDRLLPTTWEAYIAGILPRSKEHKASSRFLDLGLTSGGQEACHTSLESRRPPPLLKAWSQSMLNWAKAEAISLLKEDMLGLRKYPISMAWNTIPTALQVAITTDDPPRHS